jgi:hypothetical protein
MTCRNVVALLCHPNDERVPSSFLNPCHWRAAPFINNLNNSFFVCLQAYGAIEAQGVHLVVANELHSRKDQVWLVTAAADKQARLGSMRADWLSDAATHAAFCPVLINVLSGST